VCDFIEKLPHVEGHLGDADMTLEPAQIFILSVVFGWRRVNDGLRRFSTVYIEMARKGAKSTLTAGVALYCLCCEGEVGPQIVIGATTGEQAGKVFNPAKKMVERTEDLREAFGSQAFSRSIACKSNGGFIQPINAKGKTQDGWNPHLGILDELHAHKDRALFDVIKSAFGARKNPLLWVITTAGFDTVGVCYEQRTFVTKIARARARGRALFRDHLHARHRGRVRRTGARKATTPSTSACG
jgi:phage terminase large subunit-like protein